MANRIDFERKLSRLRALLAEQGCKAAILGRRDNFAWLSSGGDNTVLRCSEAGFGLVVVDMRSVKLVGYSMDAQRIVDDELGGLGVEPIKLNWYEESREERAMSICGPGRVLADLPIPGTVQASRALTRLHYPLSDVEVQRSAELASASDRILRSVADILAPEMTEAEVASRLASEYGAEGIDLDVLLVGGGERIAQYRHPQPTDNRIGSTVLLHTAARRRGLHANVTRMVCLGGRVPTELERSYEALCQAEALTFALCEPGMAYRQIFAERRSLLEKLGYGDEWELHFPGGITGYILGDGAIGDAPDENVLDGQTFDWFITITGAKVEELLFTSVGKRRVLSVTGAWPTRRYSARGFDFDLPVILVR